MTSSARPSARAASSCPRRDRTQTRFRAARSSQPLLRSLPVPDDVAKRRAIRDPDFFALAHAVFRRQPATRVTLYSIGPPVSFGHSLEMLENTLNGEQHGRQSRTVPSAPRCNVTDCVPSETPHSWRPFPGKAADPTCGFLASPSWCRISPAHRPRSSGPLREDRPAVPARGMFFAERSFTDRGASSEPEVRPRWNYMIRHTSVS